ncbi:MAG: hypothetical protein AAF447_27510 [Myxococcota bacterium]
MLETILRAGLEGLIRGIEIQRGEAVPQEEIDAAFTALARNPPRKARLPDDFPKLPERND